MRILHVVTLISPDAAYGGPLRVAMNQTSALRGRGHEVAIAATARGFERLPDAVGDVACQAFTARVALPGIGHAGLRGAGMTRWLAQHVRDFDVVHVHLARDFVTLPAARACLRKRVPLVVQPHGMIDHTTKLLARPLDRWWTRPVLRGADAVLHLTAHEKQDLREVAGALSTFRPLANGVPTMAARDEPEAGGPPEVLFLARLSVRKRPAVFVEMAHRLIAGGSRANFAIVGPDEGILGEVEALITRYGLSARVRYEGALSPDRVADRMRRASVYVLPAVDEPFGMSVVEAMSVGVPVVVTDTCGLAPLIEESGSGIVVGPDLDTLTAAVARILDQPGLLDTMGANGRRTVAQRLSMSSVAERLELIYQQAAGATEGQR